jgi:apolipoprotein N-acyltransferase
MFRWRQELSYIMGWLRSSFMKWTLSGILLGVGFSFPVLWPLALFGAAYYLYLLQESSSVKNSIFGSWLAWTVKSFFTLGWIMTVYPMDWLPSDIGSGQLTVVTLCWFLSALSVGLGGVAMALLHLSFKGLLKEIITPISFLFIAFFWVFGEVFGSLAYSLLSFGPGGGLNIALSFGYGGYALANHELLLPIAKFAGVYGLSFLFALLIQGLLFFARKRSHLYYVAMILLVIYATSFINSRPHMVPTEDGYKVVIVETYHDNRFVQDEGRLWAKKSLEEAMDGAVSTDAEYIILPEGAQYFNQENSVGSVRSIFKLKYDNPTAVIIDSGYTTDSDVTVLQSFIYDGQTDTVEKVQKAYLVPQGEYISYTFMFLADLVGYGTEVRMLNDQMTYRVGSRVDQSDLDDHLPAVLFCLDSVSPYGVRTIIKDRENVPFVAHPISHAWFHNPYVLWYQQDLMLKVQAVWNNKYIVSAANQSISKTATPTGHLIVPEVKMEGDGWRLREIIIPR